MNKTNFQTKIGICHESMPRIFFKKVLYYREHFFLIRIVIHCSYNVLLQSICSFFTQIVSVVMFENTRVQKIFLEKF